MLFDRSERAEAVGGAGCEIRCVAGFLSLFLSSNRSIYRGRLSTLSASADWRRCAPAVYCAKEKGHTELLKVHCLSWTLFIFWKINLYQVLIMI